MLIFNIENTKINNQAMDYFYFKFNPEDKSIEKWWDSFFDDINSLNIPHAKIPEYTIPPFLTLTSFHEFNIRLKNGTTFIEEIKKLNSLEEQITEYEKSIKKQEGEDKSNVR